MGALLSGGTYAANSAINSGIRRRAFSPEAVETVQDGAEDVTAEGEREITVGEGQNNTAPEGGTAEGLVPLSEKMQQSLSTGKNNFIARTTADIVSFVKSALQKKGGPERLYMGSLPDSAAELVKNSTDVDVTGFNAILQGDYVQHIFNNHGDEQTESLRGQRAVTAEDIALLPQVLAAPDSATLSDKTDSSGRKVLIFEKQIGDNYVTAQAVTDGRHALSTDSFLIQKKKNPLVTTHNADISAAPVDNVRNAPPSGSSNANVSQPGADVNHESDEAKYKNSGEYRPSRSSKKANDSKGMHNTAVLDTTVPQPTPDVNPESAPAWANPAVAENAEGQNNTAPEGGTESAGINTSPKGHTQEEQRTIEEYTRSTDSRLFKWLNRIKSALESGDMTASKMKIVLGKVNQRASNAISSAIEIDTTGFSHMMDGSAVQHIDLRHGVNGQADSSMSNTDDLARVGFILDTFDDCIPLKNEDGSPALSKQYRDAKNNPAPMVQFQKKIDGTYYVVEAVPDSADNKLHIVSAYMQKNSGNINQVLNVPKNSPQHASETPLDPVVSADTTVPQPSPNVNLESAPAQTNPAVAENAEGQKNSAPEGTGNVRITDSDEYEYMNTGSRPKIKAAKQTAVNAGEKIVLTSVDETRDYIREAISGATKGVIPKAYGKVGSAMADDIYAVSNGAFDVEGWYLELVPSDLRHAFVQHSNAKQSGNISLTEEDFLSIPDYIDTYDDVLECKTFSNGEREIILGKKINGYSVIVEIVSRSRKSLSFKNMWGVDTPTYEAKYKNSGEYRPSRSSKKANDSKGMHNTAVLDTTVPQSSPDVNPESAEQTAPGGENSGFRNIGAAEAGFTTPTRGNIVYTQNETMSHGVDLTEEERQKYTPGVHERMTAQMSRERAEGLFYQDESGDVINVEETVAELLEKDAWTGVEQDAAQMAFRQMKGRLSELTAEQYSSFQALSRAIEEIGGTEAGRSLQAWQKWVESGDGIVSRSMTILDDPRIDPEAARHVMEQIGNLSSRYDSAEKAGDMEGYFQIIREAALLRRTSKGTSEQIRRTAEWAMEQIKARGDVDFARNAARASIIAMAQDCVPQSATAKLKKAPHISGLPGGWPPKHACGRVRGFVAGRGRLRPPPFILFDNRTGPKA